MSRRGRAGPVISLFAFQDIITSVTAIVTVIALLLALDLVQRKQTQATDSSSQMVNELAAWLKSAEAEASKLRSTVLATDDLVQEVAAVSPTELRDELAARAAEIERALQEQSRLQTLAGKLEAELKLVQVEAFDLEPVRIETEDLERQADDLKQQRQAVEADDRPVFSLPKGFNKEGWLAVVGSQTITVAPLGRPARPMTFSASNGLFAGKSAAEELLTWIDREQNRTIYLLLLTRPGGERTLDEVAQLLSNNDVAFGYDLIGDDETMLHPERGAAP